MPAVVEFELKLAGRADKLRALPRALTKAGYKVGPAAGQSLVTAYFDTPDHDLQKAGIVWRVRRRGRANLQSIKYRPDRDGGVTGFAYEIEAASKLTRPDPAMLKDPGLGDHANLEKILSAAFSSKGFGPVFETRIRRTIHAVTGAGKSVVELALDLGTITAGGKSLDICEAEIELKSGKPDAVFALAGIAVQNLDLRIEPESKAARGFRFALGAGPEIQKAQPVMLPKGADVHEALYQVLVGAFAQIAVNGRVFEQTKDPEAVHQLRVGVRRARAAFGLFRPVLTSADAGDLKARLKVLADGMSRLRDLDVLTDDVLPKIMRTLARSGSDADPAQLLRAAQTARQAARAAAEKLVGSKDYSLLLIDFNRFITLSRTQAAPARGKRRTDTNLVRFAEAALEERLKRLGQSAAKMPRMSRNARHRMRIELKKLRYGGAFFESLYPPGALRPFLSAASELQDLLGKMNDAFVAESVIKSLIEESPAGTRSELAFAGGLAVGIAGAGTVETWAQVVKMWPKFVELTPFWRKE